jgi:hypothetical protein
VIQPRIASFARSHIPEMRVFEELADASLGTQTCHVQSIHVCMPSIDQVIIIVFHQSNVHLYDHDLSTLPKAFQALQGALSKVSMWPHHSCGHKMMGPRVTSGLRVRSGNWWGGNLPSMRGTWEASYPGAPECAITCKNHRTGGPPDYTHKRHCPVPPQTH